MDFLQILTLSIVQGFSEFLPISSSAHLILVREFFGWSSDNSLIFDVALHVGTLIAIIIYFKNSIFSLITDFCNSIIRRKIVGSSNIGWAVVFGTIPVGLVGLFLGDYLETYSRSSLVIGSTTVIFGILLYIANKFGTESLSLDNITIKLAIIIGIAQAIALIPGVSRSGITMTAALFLGFSRPSSAEFSFLLSIPVIILAGLLESTHINKIEHTINFNWSDIFLGIFLSAISAYVCVKLFMAIISRISMLPFVFYRLLLGGILLFLNFG